jgi:hypothetical protein
MYVFQTAAGALAALDRAISTFDAIIGAVEVSDETKGYTCIYDGAGGKKYFKLAGGHVKIRCGGHVYEDFVYNNDTRAVLNLVALTQEWGETQLNDIAESSCALKGKSVYYVSAGETNWTVFSKLYNTYGVHIPGGSCYSVGIGGHITGGGNGIMSRLYGLTVDWLDGVEVVIKPKANEPAALVRVFRGSNFFYGQDDMVLTPQPVLPVQITGDDLYWAHTGGGGGNFGLVTKYYFKKLPQAPMGAYRTSVAFNWEDLDKDRLKKIFDFYYLFGCDGILYAELIDAEREYFAGLLSEYPTFDLPADEYIPQDRDGVSIPMTRPDRMKSNRKSSVKFQLFHKAKGQIHMELHTAYFSEAEKTRAIATHNKFNAALRELFPKMVDDPTKILTSFTGHGGFTGATGAYSFFASTQDMNGSGPNRRGKYKSAYQEKPFDAADVAVIYKYLTMEPVVVGYDTVNGKQVPVYQDMTNSIIQVDCFGGRIREYEAHETAVPQRKYVWKLQYQTYWLDKDHDSFYLKWIRDFYEEMYDKVMLTLILLRTYRELTSLI